MRKEVKSSTLIAFMGEENKHRAETTYRKTKGELAIPSQQDIPGYFIIDRRLYNPRNGFTGARGPPIPQRSRKLCSAVGIPRAVSRARDRRVQPLEYPIGFVLVSIERPILDLATLIPEVGSGPAGYGQQSRCACKFMCQRRTQTVTLAYFCSSQLFS